MSSQRQKIEIGGVSYHVTFGAAADLVEHPDGSTETVYDLEAWMAERQPTTDGGSQPFGGSTCPMCGESYECGYTTHLQRCEPR